LFAQVLDKNLNICENIFWRLWISRKWSRQIITFIFQPEGHQYIRTTCGFSARWLRGVTGPEEKLNGFLFRQVRSQKGPKKHISTDQGPAERLWKSVLELLSF